MSREVYRSANGKAVDMGALRLKNEKTRAVGNMKVNARGDEINEQGQVIRKKTEQVNNQYQRQTKTTLPSSRRGDRDV
jgi:hypothetical protein